MLHQVVWFYRQGHWLPFVWAQFPWWHIWEDHFLIQSGRQYFLFQSRINFGPNLGGKMFCNIWLWQAAMCRGYGNTKWKTRQLWLVNKGCLCVWNWRKHEASWRFRYLLPFSNTKWIYISSSSKAISVQTLPSLLHLQGKIPRWTISQFLLQMQLWQDHQNTLTQKHKFGFQQQFQRSSVWFSSAQPSPNHSQMSNCSRL